MGVGVDVGMGVGMGIGVPAAEPLAALHRTSASSEGGARNHTANLLPVTTGGASRQEDASPPPRAGAALRGPRPVPSKAHCRR
jgi:hypothetical protein